MSVEQIMYKLECGHIVLAPTFLVNGKLNCHEHGKQKITNIPTYEWRAKCGNCKWARWTGMSDIEAVTLATFHSARHPGHNTYSEYVVRPAAVATLKKYRNYHGIAESANL